MEAEVRGVGKVEIEIEIQGWDTSTLEDRIKEHEPRMQVTSRSWKR